MRRAALILAAIALPALAAQAAAAPSRRAAPASHDWARVVVATPEGGFRMGNPAARVKIVEYGSLACPHCRHFEETGYRPLVQNYVRTGRVSYEFRTYILNAPDISVALLAHCAGARQFFPMSEVVYATQPQWVAKVRDMPEADRTAIEKMTDAQRLSRLAEIAGFPQLAARFGVTPARARQCLADPAGLKRLLDMVAAENARGLSHIPTFYVDGTRTEALTWEEIEPLIRKAVGG
jgi:protein-disulfide isomerase